MFEIIKISKSTITQSCVPRISRDLLHAPLIFMDTGITLRMQCWCDMGIKDTGNSRSGLYTETSINDTHSSFLLLSRCTLRTWAPFCGVELALTSPLLSSSGFKYFCRSSGFPPLQYPSTIIFFNIFMHSRNLYGFVMPTKMQVFKA